MEQGQLRCSRRRKEGSSRFHSRGVVGGAFVTTISSADALGRRATHPAEVPGTDFLMSRRALRDAHALVKVRPFPAIDASTDRSSRRQIHRSTRELACPILGLRYFIQPRPRCCHRRTLVGHAGFAHLELPGAHSSQSIVGLAQVRGGRSRQTRLKFPVPTSRCPAGHPSRQVPS